MSIKKLFDSANKNTNFSDYASDKDKYEFVESSRNAEQIITKNDTFIPQIDYSDPKNFVKFGSAYYFYKGALTRISEYYPYDGSDAEKNKFYNGLLEGEKYIFNSLYPSSTGYALLSADGWGALDGSKTWDGYGLPVSLEYITFKGGPLTSSGASLVAQGPNPDDDKIHFSNIYDENIYQTAGLPDNYGKGTRLSNLRSDFDNGVTVEFWLKKDAFDTNLTEKEVVVDVWNNYVSSSEHYGRITIELDGTAGASPFLITAHSGNISGSVITSSIGADLTVASLASWGHYALSFHNTGSNFIVKLYQDGVLNDTNTYTGNINELNSKGMMGRVGALLTAPSGSVDTTLVSSYVGAGKLSASLDEFRFWKTTRNSQQVSRNWFTDVNGGVNTDISNTTLGLYYKFNEGIVGSSSIDSIVLDYGGRLSNGVWTGYDSASRNTGSAMVSASATLYEPEDPIVRTDNAEYLNLSSSLMASGTFHDLNNQASFVNYAPSWILEEHENNGNSNLKIISHIMGTYFDRLYLLAREIPKLRQADYVTASLEPVPFARHLPQSLGMYMAPTFVDSTIVERLLDRNNTELFEANLEDTKNLIYLNLYNNLTHIFKSKGTEKAISNVLRCFNLDDSLLQFKQYADNTTYEIENNLIQKKVKKNFINFNTASNTQGVVYQAIDSSNADSSGYISGSVNSDDDGVENCYGATVEAEIQFPFYLKSLTNVSRDDTDISLFGVYTTHTASAASLNGTDTTFVSSSNDYANFQVFAVRDTAKSKNVYFKLTSSNVPYPLPQLTSSTFFEVYNNTDWNFSVRLKPSNYPLSGLVSGSQDYTYDVIFKGTNTELGAVVNGFEATGSITYTSGSNFLKYPKRMYVGARRENITGTILQTSDVLAASAKYWTKYLDDESLLQHSNDFFNSGISGSYQNISPLQLSSSALDLINLNTLALDWNFQQVTASDGTGNFITQDFSSGSALIRDNYGWLGSISGYQHTGYAYGFGASNTNVVNKKDINIFEFVDPEQAVSSEMIKILDEDDKVFELIETVPSYLFTLEKSMQAAISTEMLKFFSGIIDFNNVIGDPVNRYRERYKNLEKLREIFFRRVTKTSDVEKFIDYYKWFDSAISSIVSQLVPASADFIENAMNIIEPHALERDKYQTKFPTLEFQEPTIEGSVKAISEKIYDWELGSSTIPSSPRNTTKHMLFWKDRAKRNSEDITSGDATIDSQRETIRQVTITRPFLSSSLPRLNTVDGAAYQPSAYSRRRLQKLYDDKIEKSQTIKGGVNFPESKNIALTYNALAPAGPVNQEGGIFVPRNVLLAFMEDMVEQPIDNDPKLIYKKNRRHVKVLHGRDYEDGTGYKSVKSNIIFPFNLISSSVSGGYQAHVMDKVSGSVMITNLHNDVYGPMMEKPMQGPFTDYAVGGHQSRHIRLNRGSDTWYNRPEAWKLLLGTMTDDTTTIEESGAIGMAGADYPWPEANAEDVTPYPMTASQKAVYYRDMVAKRPVNIRNIKHITGSTILGNYNNNYDVVSTFGAYSNPRNFIQNQPTLPSQVIQNNMTSSTSVRTFLDIRRDNENHTSSVSEYSLSYLTSALSNSSVISTRFSAPGGIEVLTPGYTDFRANEFSVYNSLNYRNLSVRGIFQTSGLPSGSSGSVDRPPTGSGGTTAITVNDIHNKAFALRSHLARHTAKFGRDSLFVTGTSAVYENVENQGAPGASYNQFPSMFKIPRNRIDVQKLDSIGADYSSSIYDNYFVSQQIPKSTLNYSWISASYVSFNDRYGIVRPDFRISSSTEGMINCIDFVTASDFVSYRSPGGRAFGKDAQYAPSDMIATDFVGLNTNIIDQVLTESATLGDSLDLTTYLNYELNPLLNTEGTASALNALILNRQGPYGHPSWKQIRQRDNKVLRSYRNNNRMHFVSSTGSYNSQADFEMPPVSLRGRTLTVAIEDFNTQVAPDWDIYGLFGTNLLQTYKADFSNNYVYFNLDKFEDQFDLNYFGKTTAGQQMIEIGNSAGFALDWILYTENIFPSQRNEFLSQSRNKVDYNNKYWRDSNADRVTLGDTFNNTQNIDVSQSAWILDAPADFLTRRTPPFATEETTPSVTAPQLRDLRDSLRISASAGELQNTYFTYFTCSSIGVGAELTEREKGAVLTPGALYARKHLISSPRSVATPSGMEWALTGANTGPFDSSAQIQIYSGEAYWETGPKAGIITKNIQSGPSTGVSLFSIFESHQSNPWFNSYEDFNYLIKKVSNAKEFAIVPEYRSSEHAEDYVMFGEFLDNKHDSFSIPETTISSSNDDFYIDYSNSEFLKEFLNINNLASQDLQATEIRLVCSGTIRFNPYKSFYPAQRATDLVERFYKSYSQPSGSFYGAGSWGDGFYAEGISGSMIKSLYQPLFAPGILFNTIKAGLAVEWPVVTDYSKVQRTQYGDNTNAAPNNWAVSADPSKFTTTASFWDKRLDFESIIFPEEHLNKMQFFDMDTHPSASVSASYSFTTEGDTLYSAMASNFFGGVADFYLKDSNFTSLKSKVIDDVVVDNTKVYMARVKLRRSMTGPRNYSNEYTATNTGWGNTAFGIDGGRLLVTASGGTAFDYDTTALTFPLPQDPMRATGSATMDPYRETFTMYSRPSAFGPALAGISANGQATVSKYLDNTIYDSFNGLNSAYTPPYYNGEAWCDIIFRPTGSEGSARITIEELIQQSNYVYWRMDPGYASSSFTVGSSGVVRKYRTSLIYDDSVQGKQAAPYGGPFINENSMQISASIDLFGVESAPQIQTNLSTKEQLVTNTSTGTRWVISPKFETPMMNFNDLSAERPLTQSSVSLPANYGQAAVPRGMWHQFGIIEPDSSKGIFLEIGDIPTNWLSYHYDVRMNDTVYNDNDALNNGPRLSRDVESLSDLVGFSTSPSRKLGELKDNLTVYEAIVAIPYVIETLEPSVRKDISLTEAAKDYKKFISIPRERYEAALTASIGTATGDSLDAAGGSIRRQAELMEKYIFPPELDFVSNEDLDPIAMYIFEFEYHFDRDDLSYMWQNIAPRGYQKITQQSTTVSHELIDTELLTETNLTENENLRWMVFKVKQRSQKLYSQFKTTQAKDLWGDVREFRPAEIEPLYNWPHDYLSFVEKISIDAQILFKADENKLMEREDLEKNKLGQQRTSPSGQGYAGTRSIPLSDPTQPQRPPITSQERQPSYPTVTAGPTTGPTATSTGIGPLLDQTPGALPGREGYKTATGTTTNLAPSSPQDAKAPTKTPVLSQEALDRARERLKNK
tara:strand:- start:4450 stop:14187 length:9738 start_codon:yes stop_codon:yes gene_type:complete